MTEAIQPSDNQNGMKPMRSQNLFWQVASSMVESKGALLGLIVCVTIVLLAIFAPWVAPQDPYNLAKLNIMDSRLSPGSKSIDGGTYWLGTDGQGRDMISAMIYGLRTSLAVGMLSGVFAIVVGTVLGLLAAYRGGWVDTLIMRVTDIFVAVPPLVLALAVCSVLTPNVFNAMMAVTLMWWPWYCRLVYGIASSLRNEFFVQAAEVTGAGKLHILFKEILPNCYATLFTKMSLDMGWVILIGSALSFVGLGAQPPTPDLGTMVADGAKYIPDQWWIAVFPAFAIMFIVLGFNLLGDGIRDMLAVEET